MCGQEDNIKMCCKEILRDSLDWIDLAEDAVQWRAPADTKDSLL